MIIPERIKEDGTLYPGRQTFVKYGHSGRRTRTLFYKLVAFGRTFKFHLEQEHGFLAPAFVVEHVVNHTHRIPFAGDLTHCFYRGQVAGDPVSTGVFSLCQGLVSTYLPLFSICHTYIHLSLSYIKQLLKFIYW